MPDDEKNMSSNIELNEKCEKKFFKLLQVLVKNHEDNQKKLKSIKDQIDGHMEVIAADMRQLEDKKKANPGSFNQWDKESVAHITNIKERITLLA